MFLFISLFFLYCNVVDSQLDIFGKDNIVLLREIFLSLLFAHLITQGINGQSFRLCLKITLL